MMVYSRQTSEDTGLLQWPKWKLRQRPWKPSSSYKRSARARTNKKNNKKNNKKRYLSFKKGHLSFFLSRFTLGSYLRIRKGLLQLKKAGKFHTNKKKKKNLRNFPERFAYYEKLAHYENLKTNVKTYRFFPRRFLSRFPFWRFLFRSLHSHSRSRSYSQNLKNQKNPNFKGNKKQWNQPSSFGLVHINKTKRNLHSCISNLFGRQTTLWSFRSGQKHPGARRRTKIIGIPKSTSTSTSIFSKHSKHSKDSKESQKQKGMVKYKKNKPLVFSKQLIKRRQIRRNTRFSFRKVLQATMDKLLELGFTNLVFQVKGAMLNKKFLFKNLNLNKHKCFRIMLFKQNPGIAHNGCRPKKVRRL
jgi:ribosomal protein S11